MKTLIKNVRPYGEGEAVNVLLSDGVIEYIGAEEKKADEVYDGSNNVLLPGMVDLSANLGEPGEEENEDLRSGSQAAAKGGITAVFAQPNTNPVIDEPVIAEAITLKSSELGLCDIIPVPSITKGRKGEKLSEFGLLRDSFAHTRFFSEGKKSVANSVIMRRAMEYAHGTDVVISEFCQEEKLSENAHAHEGVYSGKAGIRGIPRSAEESIAARDVLLAREFDAELHLATISSKGTVEIVQHAKEDKTKVTASVAAHNLVLDDSTIAGYDAIYKVLPPLRAEEDKKALVEALLDGTIDCVVSDHTPVSREHKAVEFDRATPGMIGLETTLPLLAETFVESGKADWHFIAKIFSEKPAEIAGLEDQGKKIEVGAPANLTVVNEDGNWTVEEDALASKSSNTPFLGKKFKAQVQLTFLRGNVTYQA